MVIYPLGALISPWSQGLWDHEISQFAWRLDGFCCLIIVTYDEC